MEFGANQCSGHSPTCSPSTRDVAIPNRDVPKTYKYTWGFQNLAQGKECEIAH